MSEEIAKVAPEVKEPIVADSDALVVRKRRKSRQVTIVEENAGGEEYEVPCTLLEMNGTQRAEWTNFANSRTKTEGEFVRIVDFKGYQATLIAKNLKRNETGKYFTIDEIVQFPTTGINKLYEASLVLNELATTTEKKQEGTGS